MVIDSKELDKLPVRERLEKLKKLKEEKKKEVGEIDKLISEFSKELRVEKIAESAPEQQAVDITSLFEKGTDLEASVKEKTEGAAGASAGAQYEMQAQQLKYDYSRLKGMMPNAIYGSLSEEQRGTIDSIGERLQRTRYEAVSQEVANIVVASRAALHKIRRYAGLE